MYSTHRQTLKIEARIFSHTDTHTRSHSVTLEQTYTTKHMRSQHAQSSNHRGQTNGTVRTKRGEMKKKNRLTESEFDKQRHLSADNQWTSSHFVCGFDVCLCQFNTQNKKIKWNKTHLIRARTVVGFVQIEFGAIRTSWWCHWNWNEMKRHKMSISFLSLSVCWTWKKYLNWVLPNEFQMVESFGSAHMKFLSFENDSICLIFGYKFIYLTVCWLNYWLDVLNLNVWNEWWLLSSLLPLLS